jgi:hypothetical protein
LRVPGRPCCGKGRRPRKRDKSVAVIQNALLNVHLANLISEDRAMSDWIIIYRTSPGTKETRSPSAPSERRALAQARTLHMQGCEVIRIQGPDDFLVPDKRIEQWVTNGRDRHEFAD